MPNEKRKFGNMGEKIACYFLKREGYSILETNYQKRVGEIDIITKLNNGLHFVEVKTRTNFSNNKFGAPQESVNYRKQKRLIKTALFYLLENKYSDNTNWQIDVIAITINKNKNTAKINHIKNAVDYDTR
ncbi:MAG: YraN family protein [Patescibacteria group bacterium]|nr:YraN family protein [Patescibacteria group bacterium]